MKRFSWAGLLVKSSLKRFCNDYANRDPNQNLLNTFIGSSSLVVWALRVSCFLVAIVLEEVIFSFFGSCQTGW